MYREVHVVTCQLTIQVSRGGGTAPIYNVRPHNQYK